MDNRVEINCPKIVMIDCQGSIEVRIIEKIEANIGVQFPSSFKNIIKNCDAGSPEQRYFNFWSTALGRYDQIELGNFLSFSPQYPYEKFLNYYLEPPEFFIPGLIAFAIEGGGNLMCFDYRKEKNNSNPSIVLWEISAPNDAISVSFLAPNFEAFINMLKNEEEANKELEALRQKGTFKTHSVNLEENSPSK